MSTFRELGFSLPYSLNGNLSQTTPSLDSTAEPGPVADLQNASFSCVEGRVTADSGRSGRLNRPPSLEVQDRPQAVTRMPREDSENYQDNHDARASTDFWKLGDLRRLKEQPGLRHTSSVTSGQSCNNLDRVSNTFVMASREKPTESER